MASLRFLATASLALFCYSLHAASPEDRKISSFVNQQHAEVLKRWFAQNPGYRLATDQDCHCDSDLVEIRTVSSGAWKADPTYHPYYTTGDFNWDGKEDFAVGVVAAKIPDKFRVVIFHGSFGPKHSARAAFVSELLLLGQGMFYGPPRPMPYMLVVGAFESEGALLKPTPKGYVWDEGGEE
jgi:hypothetical protein